MEPRPGCKNAWRTPWGTSVDRVITSTGEAKAGSPPKSAFSTDASRVYDIVAAALVFLAGLLSNLFTVLNNAYATGATLYDSTIFQTIIWRSGWTLSPAPAVDDISFLNTHFSPINYFPDLLSYVVPVDRLTYCGIIYGFVYGSLLVLTLFALRGLVSTLPAIVGTMMLYLSGEILNAQWEPHQEIASSLLTLAFFLAWTGHRAKTALICLVLNAMVREDCGMLLALPLFMLAGHQAWQKRSDGTLTLPSSQDLVSRLSLRYPDALGCAVLSTGLSIAAFEIKKTFFNGHDVVAAFYYGDALRHLTPDLLHQRVEYYLHHGQYLWLPGVVLTGGAILLRDVRLAFGWLAFFPYWLFSFLSAGELNAEMGAYKAFPLVLSLVWPAVVFRMSPWRARTGLAMLQAAVLVAGCVSYENGAVRLGAPFDLDGSLQRWLPQADIRQAPVYSAFEPRLDHVADLGRVRASQGVLALYPYQFPRWDFSSITDQVVAQAADLDSLLWFEGDRDASQIETILRAAAFPHRYRVRGSHMLLATRLPAARLTAFSEALEPVTIR